MIRSIFYFALVSVSLSTLSCKKERRILVKEYTDTFSAGIGEWRVLFADYPVGGESFYELESGVAPLPAPLDPGIKALKVSGNNHSDDLMMMIYRKISGLKPNRRYEVIFNVDLASNALKNSPGVGGSPDLCLGAGGMSFQPVVERKPTGGADYYRPNFESKIQGCITNSFLQVIGKIGVHETLAQYALINRNNEGSSFSLTTNSAGEAWVVLGLDSGFEGVTTLYYKGIQIRLYE